jgi:hypothetical protein
VTPEQFVMWLQGYFELGDSHWVDERNRPKSKSTVKLFWGEEKIRLIRDKLFSVTLEGKKELSEALKTKFNQDIQHEAEVQYNNHGRETLNRVSKMVIANKEQ